MLLSPTESEYLLDGVTYFIQVPNIAPARFLTLGGIPDFS